MQFDSAIPILDTYIAQLKTNNSKDTYIYVYSMYIYIVCSLQFLEKWSRYWIVGQLVLNDNQLG